MAKIQANFSSSSSSVPSRRAEHRSLFQHHMERLIQLLTFLPSIMAKKTQPRRCRQDGRCIAAYYDDFNTTRHHLCGAWSCGWDTSLIKQRNEDDKTRHFLMGLDLSYDTLRSNLLAKRPLPSLDEVYELLVQPGKRRHLPADLLPLILSRLPVKSLLRFRCVAKPWLALVDEDADFATLHFDVFNKNLDESKLLVVESNNECAVRCSDTFELVSEIPFDSPTKWRFVSCVDGLVLLESCNYRNGVKALKIWNPSIRQFCNIKPHPPFEFSKMINVVGFGYDPLSKEYKVVMLVRAISGLIYSVLVCSVGTGSWKTIPFQVEGLPCPILRGNLALRNVVYQHGSLHFIARKPLNISILLYLLSFDLSNEVFSRINMPNVRHAFWPSDYTMGEKLILIGGGSSLALYDNFSRDEALWVLEKETNNWTKHCRSALKNTESLYGMKNGDMLILGKHEDTFLDKTGYRKSSWRNEVALYCPEKRQYKILLDKQRSSRDSWIKHASVFVESLKLHNDSFRERKVCEQNRERNDFVNKHDGKCRKRRSTLGFCLRK